MAIELQLCDLLASWGPSARMREVVLAVDNSTMLSLSLCDDGAAAILSPAFYAPRAVVLGGGLQGAPLRCARSQWRRGASRKPPSSIIAFVTWVATTVLEMRKDLFVECRSAQLGLFVF
jgi:hypothetical protein